MPFVQDDRLLVINSPLGDGELLLTAFNGHEELSRPFSFQLQLVCDNDAIAAADLVGKPISWKVVLPDESPRQFHGRVNRFFAGPSMGRGLRNYRAEVVPWLWFLTRATDCRIYQNKSVPDIIEDVFRRYNFSDFELNLSGTYPVREYCVQYRESAFQFVSRLMEEEGIFYTFTFAEDAHMLVLADGTSAYIDAEAHAEVEYRPEMNDSEVVTTWEREYAFITGKAATTDYNFLTPSTDLLSATDTTVSLTGIATFEQFDYPGRHAATDRGSALARVRIEELEATYDTIRGSSRCSSFRPGAKFTLQNHPTDNGNYAFQVVTHSATDPNIPGVSSGIDTYSNSFQCLPAAVVFRPQRLTPMPRVAGPQSALIVGPSGAEIHTDEHGRVKVQFPWDRIGEKNEASSCWVRVSEAWAGKNWGAVFLPRIGQEVLVEFLNGDPDQPIVTGRVYNAENMPPYALPDNATQSGIKTRSTAGGDAETFNELRFEDKKDNEDIYFHAQKDFHRVVENDDDLQVLHDQSITVTNNRTLTVKEGNETITIEQGNRERTVKTGNDTLNVDTGNRAVTVKTGNDTHNVDTGNRAVIVKTGNDTHTVKTGNREVLVELGNDTLTVKAGNQTVKVDAGSSTTEAAQSITLKVGSNIIEITSSGITISGMTVKIQGEMQASVKSVNTEIAGDATVKVQGGIITLN